MSRYLLVLTGLHGRPIFPFMLGYEEAPVVVLDSETCCPYTPVRWLRLRGAAQ